MIFSDDISNLETHSCFNHKKKFINIIKGKH